MAKYWAQRTLSVKIGIFVLLGLVSFLGVFSAQEAFAAPLCSASTDGWKGANFACDIVYEENAQGSGLSACEYSLKNAGEAENWQSAGTCSGATATLTITVSVGSGGTCTVEGQDKCVLSARATDNSGNTSPATGIGTYDIDYTPPSTPVLSSPASPTNDQTPTWNWTASTDSGSGLAAVPYTIEWSQSSIFSPAVTSSASVSSTSFTHTTNLATGTWYSRVRATDQAGRNSAWSNTGTIVIDANAPAISSFEAVPSPPGWVNSSTAIATVTWTVVDNEGNLDEVQMFRANFNQNGCNDTDKSQCSWSWQQTADAPSGSGSWSYGVINVPPGNPSAVHWYGIHAIDTLGNSRTETEAGLSPRKVQVDKANPTNPGTPAATTPPQDSTPTWQWGASTDTGGSGILRYHVQWSTNLSFPAPVSEDYTTQTTYTHQQELTQNTTWYFRVRAQDVAGNFSSYATGFVVLSTNFAPVISSVSDAPNAIVQQNTQITLTANWSDPEGDPAQLFFCKTNQAVSPAGCNGGISNTYCGTSGFSTTNPLSCNYTTVSSDQPQKTYYGFICDNQGACSSSAVSGVFEVDATKPNISSFGINPTTVTSGSPSVVVSWNVSDAGGSHLKQIEIWRREINEPDTQFAKMFTVCTAGGVDIPCAPGAVDSWNSSISYNPPGPDATYLYGIHVLDNVDHVTYETTAQPPVARVEVVVNLNQAPTASISCNPGTCQGYQGDVLLWVNDSTDPDGSSDIAQSRWDILNYGSSPDATCSGLCNYAVPSQSPGSYSATLTVQDAGGLENTSNPVLFTVLQDIIPSFDCSLNGSSWQQCSQVNPAKGQTVFFRDTSVASQGASITSWAWTFAGGTPASSSQQNPLSSFQTTGLHQVSLTVTDSAGRQDSIQANVNVAPQFPEYQEISPF